MTIGGMGGPGPGPGGGGRGGFRGVDEAAQRRANAEAPHIPNLGRRMAALFSPYPGQLIATVVLVVAGAALAVVPPLIVQRIFDDALFPADGAAQLALLWRLVAAMVGLFLLTALLGIGQTWLTSSVGNRVTGDLRVRLFEHLQSMELAFFTRTKTGVIQSRLQNDVGAVSGVLTNTLTSILGNVVTVIASLAAMIVIDWRLTLIAVVQVLMASVPAVIYLVSGYLIAGGTDTLTAGTIVAFTTVQARLLQPLTGLMRVALDLQTSSAVFARIFEYLDMTPQIRDAPDAIDAAAAPGPRGQVEFRDVVFRYPDAAPDARPTLQGIIFTARPGQHVAFVGPSGAGKTTVLYLVPRLYLAAAGQVLVNGADVRHLTQRSLIDQVGIVSQETYLFHATIAENLRYAKPEATDAELADACRAANIHHVIESFELG